MEPLEARPKLGEVKSLAPGDAVGEVWSQHSVPSEPRPLGSDPPRKSNLALVLCAGM